MERDVAVVLSGGAVNGVLMELGFLKRLRESDALAAHRLDLRHVVRARSPATMAALDRLDDLEEFMLRLQPEEAFRPHSLWRLPLLGSHDYRLPADGGGAARRPRRSSRATSPRAPVEVTVFATDVSNDVHGRGRTRTSSRTRRARRRPRRWRRRSSRRRPSARSCCRGRVGDRIATDGAWVRNFPLGPRVRPARRRADRQLPLSADVSAHRHGRARAAAPPARALPEGAAREGADRRAARGRGARRARRAGALGRT